jgi:prepilin-type N-terminal cleavage/methylation domain-containing protein
MNRLSPGRSGFTLLEILVSVAVFGVVALLLSGAFFLVVRAQGFTIGTNQNTNDVGQIMSRIVHGTGTHRPLREALTGTPTIIPGARGVWTMVYSNQTRNAVTSTYSMWQTLLRYNPATGTIVNGEGRVLGRDLTSATVAGVYSTNVYGIVELSAVDVHLAVQGSRNQRAFTERMSTRVQLRNEPIAPDDDI